MTLSPDQVEALREIADWYSKAPKPDYCTGEGEDCKIPFPHTHGYAHEYPVMSLGGLAGTGKTTLMRELGTVINAVPAYGAPTHKAAAVLRGKLPGKPVSSYHSMIYIPRPEVRCLTSGRLQKVIPDPCEEPETCEHELEIIPCDGGCTECRPKEELKFERKEYFGGHKSLIVIDEASMLTEEQVEDLRSFGLPVLLIGDYGQLPPVKAKMNPWMLNPQVRLTENHRQEAGSGIIDVAMLLRKDGNIRPGAYGNDAHVLKMTDPRVPALLERFTPSEDRMLICGTNKLRSELNLEYHGEGPPREGDRLILLQRVADASVLRKDENGQWEVYKEAFLSNGTIGTVIEVEDIASYWASLLIELDGGHGIVVRSRVELAQLGNPDKLDMKKHKRGTIQWDYAYAMTAHKAQGSEASQVIVFNQPVSDGKRWSYTAVTRARDALVVLV